MKGKRLLKRGLKIVLLVALVAVVVAAVAAAWVVRRAWPETEGTIAVAGLAAPVEVVRDARGIPHIWAASAADLFYAQGYAHAQDRLWQMHLNRTVASGRLAALFGAGALPVDRYLRSIGLRRGAERDLEGLSDEAREILTAYSDGVNAFLADHRGLPVEFRLLGVNPEPWTPLDSLAWSRAMSFNLSLNGPLELLRVRIAAELGEEATARLIPPYAADGPLIVPAAGSVPAEAASPAMAALLPTLASPAWVGGSNAWAVHGSRTATGRPLLANDTHLALALPSIWYENGLHGGGFDVVGFSLPGLPFVVLGQNRRIAWGVTNLNADVQDVFLEEVDDPERPTRARFGAGWEEVERVVETLEVKGGEAEELVVYLTRHGPLMHATTPDSPLASPFAFAWAVADGSRLLDGLLALNRAAGWGEFRDALALWDSPSLNFVYADVDGNIGYQATGRVPIRPPGHDGTAPVAGWSGEAEWQGFIPFAELPSALNPPAGYVVAANHKVVGDDYPYLLTMDWPPPDRAVRILELLAGDDEMTLRDMRDVQADAHSTSAGELRPYLLAAVDPGDEQARQARELVAGWDLDFHSASPGAAIYQTWLLYLLEDTLADDLSPELYRAYLPLALNPSPFFVELMGHPDDPLFDDRGTAAREDRDAIVRASFARAVDWLAERLGDDPGAWRWGEVHRASFPHQPLGQSGIGLLEWLFNSRPVEADGEASTVNSVAGNPEVPFTPVFGVSQRYLADLADLSRSLAANSTGQSGLAFHPQRDDQVELWRDVEYHPVHTTREELAGDGTRVLTLTPR